MALALPFFWVEHWCPPLILRGVTYVNIEVVKHPNKLEVDFDRLKSPKHFELLFGGA